MKNLPVEKLAALASLGFVHVTGLKVHGPMKGQEKEIEAMTKELVGRWDTNNGKVVLVTLDGQVWLGKGLLPNELVAELCPNGQGAFVPCSNGETIWLNEILDRLAYPYANA